MDGMLADVITYCQIRYRQSVVRTPYQAQAYLLILDRANEMRARRAGAERLLFDFLTHSHCYIHTAVAPKIQLV
jgi:hypothetical protein